MLTSVDLGRMAANLRLADDTHQRVDECIALLSSTELGNGGCAMLPIRSAGRHSWRNARIGSTLAARLAGTALATRATTATPVTASKYVTASRGLMP